MHFSVEEQVSAKAGLDDVEDDLVDMVRGRGGPHGGGRRRKGDAHSRERVDRVVHREEGRRRREEECCLVDRSCLS